MPKKQSSNWYIAATHFLTSGLIALFLGVVAIGFVVPLFNISDPTIVGLVNSVFLLASAFLGLLYSASHINKKYAIPNPVSVVRLATIYLLVLQIAAVAFIFSVLLSNQVGINPVPTTIMLGQMVVGFLIFYFTSKAKIKTTV